MVDKPKQANRRALYLRLPPRQAAIIDQAVRDHPDFYPSRQAFAKEAITMWILNQGLGFDGDHAAGV